MASNQEEEILGKAYDGRLMRRLLTYLRPYKWHVVVALAAIILKSGLDVLGPYLTKIAVDKYLAKSANSHSWIGDRLSSAPLVGIAQIGGLYVGILILTFSLEFVQTYLMQWTGQKVMFDLRRQIFRHRNLRAGTVALREQRQIRHKPACERERHKLHGQRRIRFHVQYVSVTAINPL